MQIKILLLMFFVWLFETDNVLVLVNKYNLPTGAHSYFKKFTVIMVFVYFHIMGKRTLPLKPHWEFI